MEFCLIFIACLAYLLIGFFAEVLFGGDEYTDDFGWLLFLWPIMLVFFIFSIPFHGVYELAMWARKMFKMED